VSKENEPISSVPIVLVPLKEDGKTQWIFDNGFLQNPRVKTDSLGNFRMLFPNTILEGMTAFTLEIAAGVSYANIKSEEDEQIFFEIDSTTRVIQVGEIVVL
jgi:hypothetical protein